MINRANWKLYKAYLKYRADSKPFANVRSIRPTFPEYLKTARIDGRANTLSPAYFKKTINAAHQFGRWLMNNRSGYKLKTSRWLDTLRMPRAIRQEKKEHEAVTLEEIRAIAVAPAHEVWEQRIKAAAVFLFLSGMRIGAFVSLPLQAVNIPERTVKQWPSLGVKTKNGKHETTFLLNLPDLFEVVLEWDNKVRSVLPGRGYWFPPLDSTTGEIACRSLDIGKNRDARARTDLKRWLSSMGLRYYPPHKFRHGSAVYALKQAKDMADFKAISMNLMHANISVTDGIYAILSQQDISDRIGSLGHQDNQQNHTDTIAQIEMLLAQLKNQKKGI